MNKTVLVTGAGRGIGLAIAETLAREGYRMILVVRTRESAAALEARDVVASAGSRVVALDLADRAAVGDFVAGWRDPIYGIVNNAGICQTLALEADGADPWDDVLRTNLAGPYFLTKGLVHRLTRPGRIVVISSQLGREGRAGYAAYCASKFALIGMTKCWAKELGDQGITVNAVCPGWVDTEMSRIDMARLARENGVELEAYYRRICDPLELKRFNSPEEVAELVAFLLSERGAGITGRDWLMQTIWNQE